MDLKNIISVTGDKISLKRTAIIYNADNNKAKNVIDEIISVLKKYNINPAVYTTDSLSKEIDFGIVVGGDGTILRASRFYSKYGVPILGLNLGRLGFLSQAKTNETEDAIIKILDGQFKIEDRLMLSALDDEICALNDIVIKGESFSRTSRLYVQINNKTVCDYMADGLIVSTPTGSTAYTLSAGGPVINPVLETITIVPICPHTMNARPLVVPSSEIIKVITSPKPNLKICADGQDVLDLTSKNSIEIKKYQYKTKLLLLNLEENAFYSILREKLHWGLSWKG